MFKYSPNIALNVIRREDATRFYCDVLEMKLVDRHPDKQCGYELKAGPITIWLDEDCGGVAPIGNVWFEFGVDNLEVAKAKLSEHGCKMGSSTSGEGFRGQHVSDPFGMQFHLYQQL